jgi:outer membrane protein assembly factor BamD (BamD/ComL family)
MGRRTLLLFVVAWTPLAVFGGCASSGDRTKAASAHEMTKQQKQWWQENKADARYVPGKGYYVEQVGYFDADGRPMNGEAAANLRSQADIKDPDEGYDLAEFSPDKLILKSKRAIYGQPDEGVAQQLLQEGQELFRKKQYADAKKTFKHTAFRWPDSALEEDALFWIAECEFFADRYPAAEEAYAALMKKHGNSHYLDTVSRRRFAIAQYWQGIDAKSHHYFFTPNLTDGTRPLFDTAGRALKAYEGVMHNDTRGDLADISVIAVADAYFNDHRWDDADFRYKLLISDYPQSKHQFYAHQQSLKCKLLEYQGPDYDGSPLDEGEELIEQMLTQFPDKLRDPAQRDQLLEYRTKIHAAKAERDWRNAEYYAKGKHFRAARHYYAKIAQDYPSSSYARDSLARMEEFKNQPDVAPHPLQWATRWVPGLDLSGSRADDRPDRVQDSDSRSSSIAVKVDKEGLRGGPPSRNDIPPVNYDRNNSTAERPKNYEPGPQ